jgi:hypothetical protein
VRRIHGFELRKPPSHFCQMGVGVVGECGNRPWVKGHVGSLLRGTRHLSRIYMGGVVGLTALGE